MSSSVGAVQQRDTDVLKELAKDFNLTYTAFGSEISTEDDPAGLLTLKHGALLWSQRQSHPLMRTRLCGSY